MDNLKKESDNRIKAHREKMREYYRIKKKDTLKIIKDKFDKIYKKIKELGGHTEIQSLDKKKEIYSQNRFTCLCFEKLYEACKDIN
jgi:bifunctional DNA-binding transcriptional regulator/antitoxin component of YhaV-PrlF toxin-antitoxin module